MPKDWNMLHWTFRQAIKPRRIAWVLFVGAVLIDLGIYFCIKIEWPFVVFFSLALLLLLYATSYRSSGKWYDWQDADLDEWKYIKEILMLERDALTPPQKPPSWHSVWFKDGLGLLIFVLVVSVFMYRCCNDEQSVIGCLLSWAPDSLVSADKDAALVLAALIAATATVITIFMTVRQNTRSANRQAWINSIKKLMASLIAGVPRNRAKLACARKRHQRQYFKLVLHLNPSERAHRGLLYAVAVMYGAENDWLAGDCPSRDLASFDRRKECLERRVQGIARLSNVVLKMEWEQVKRLT